MVTFQGKVWIYPGQAAWHFVNLPRQLSLELREKYRAFIRGWNSLPVTVTIGGTTWQTSIFWDGKSEMYLLPIKAAVRRGEQIMVGDHVAARVKVREMSD